MRLLISASLCLCLGQVLAADEFETVTTLEVEEVVERVSEIEVIDVTSEKAPSEEVDEIDEDVSAILDEAEAVEALDD